MKNKFLMVLMSLALLASLSLTSCAIVGPSERAVKVSLGKIDPSGVVQPGGPYWYMPFVDSYQVFSLLPHEVDYDMIVGKDGGITKDNQTIGASMKGFYRLKSDAIISVYKDFGEDRISSLFATAMRQSVKAVIGQYTIFEIAANQDTIRTKVIDELRGSIADLPIEVTDIRIINYDWSDDFDKQIGATMEKAQQAKQAEQELLIVTTNAKKGVAQAEAEKLQAILRAESEKQQLILASEGTLASAKNNAEAKAAEGEGIKKYNAAIAQNLDVQLKLKALDNEAARILKWDGKYVSQNNYGPIPVQTGSLLGSK
jgi:regulator of protease activity HflC (stomatin/prohibitin superfamily)